LVVASLILEFHGGLDKISKLCIFGKIGKKIEISKKMGNFPYHDINMTWRPHGIDVEKVMLNSIVVGPRWHLVA
jgi:hypothetical protein